ncbi:MAG: hypothetical protein WD066_11190 [Planctomycetaceae bacterium]
MKSAPNSITPSAPARNTRIRSWTGAYGEFTRYRSGDTYQVSLPGWRFRAIAEGFEPSDWVFLGHSPEHHHGVRRIAPGRAKLVLPVTVRRR